MPWVAVFLPLFLPVWFKGTPHHPINTRRSPRLRLPLQEPLPLLPLPDVEAVAVVRGHTGKLAAAAGEAQCLHSTKTISAGSKKGGHLMHMITADVFAFLYYMDMYGLHGPCICLDTPHCQLRKPQQPCCFPSRPYPFTSEYCSLLRPKHPILRLHLYGTSAQAAQGLIQYQCSKVQTPI